MDYSPPGFFVHGISQAGLLEWVAISFSRGFSLPRDWTCGSYIAGRFFTTESPGKVCMYFVLTSCLLLSPLFNRNLFFVRPVSSFLASHSSHIHLCTWWISLLRHFLPPHLLTNGAPSRLTESPKFSRKSSPESTSHRFHSLTYFPRPFSVYFLYFGHLATECYSILMCRSSAW